MDKHNSTDTSATAQRAVASGPLASPEMKQTMKTTHQFARELLDGPDLPAIVATISQPLNDPPAAHPVVSYSSIGHGGIEDGPFAEIHAQCEQPLYADQCDMPNTQGLVAPGTGQSVENAPASRRHQ